MSWLGTYGLPDCPVLYCNPRGHHKNRSGPEARLLLRLDTRGKVPSATRQLRRRRHALFPVGPCAVVAVDLTLPARIGHRWPLLLVEARRSLQPLLGNIQNKALSIRIEDACAPGHRKQLVAHSEEAPKRQHRVGDLAAAHVQHDLLDMAEIVAGRVHDRIAVEG